MSSTTTTIAGAAATPRERRQRKAKTKSWQGLAFTSPAIVLLALFFFVPVFLCFALAFTNARLISPEPAKFTGLDNFQRLFADPLFWKSLRNTLYFAVIVVPLQSALALVLALLVNGQGRGKNFFRTVYFVPVVTSIVVVSIIFMSIWQAVGFHMVIWLSGLQTIPGEQYEAAGLDGASAWQKFRYVTWPGLTDTRTFILVTITIAAFSLFAQVNVMTNGGPLDATSTVVFQAVRTGFTQQQTGYASAISLVFFALVLTVSLVQRYLTRDKDL
jgi:multiple sugar transport system permease protein